MPDLEARIGEWKRSLTVAFGGSAEIIEELESHLREEIDRLTQGGKEPDSALTLALAKLGRPRDLAAEYALVTSPALWLPIPVGLSVFGLLFASCTWFFFLPKFLVGGKEVLVAHAATLIAGYEAAFFAGLLGICYVLCWLIHPIGLGQRRSLGRALCLANTSAAILLLSGLLLGLLWSDKQWGRAWNNDFAEIVTVIAVVWFGVMASLTWLAPRRQHLRVLFGIVGISVGVWGWFAPMLFRQLHAYGTNFPLLYFLLIGSIAVPLAVALLGLLPPGCLRRKLS